MALDPKAALDEALEVLLEYRPRLLAEPSIDDLAAGLGRKRISQVRDRLEAAILSYLQHAGEGEPVAWMRVEKEIHPHYPKRVDTTTDPELAAMWREHEYTETLTALYAHPAEPARVKPLEWERISETGMEEPVRFWMALDPFGGKFWINVSTADFEGACSIGDRQFATSAAAMNHLEAAYEARILSTLTTDTPVAGDGDGWEDIATAPKGEYLLLYFPKQQVGRIPLSEMIKVDRFPVSYPRQPTHWRHLPAAPQNKGGE